MNLTPPLLFILYIFCLSRVSDYIIFSSLYLHGSNFYIILFYRENVHIFYLQIIKFFFYHLHILPPYIFYSQLFLYKIRLSTLIFSLFLLAPYIYKIIIFFFFLLFFFFYVLLLMPFLPMSKPDQSKTYFFHIWPFLYRIVLLLFYIFLLLYQENRLHVNAFYYKN